MFLGAQLVPRVSFYMQVASRFVVQLASFLMIMLGIFVKLSVAFILIPDAVVGGVLIINLG